MKLMRALCFSAAAAYACCAAEPVNLAPRARIAASSEYSADYEARYAVDGQIPDAGSRDDLRRAWCVKGDTAQGRGEFTLTWPEPVPVAQIVFFARTGWLMDDTFKDYEVYLGEAAEPVARGTLAMVHGPQRIDVPAGTTAQVRLKFLNSYGGPNPGASEIAVFSERLTEGQLLDFPPSPLRARVRAGGLGFRDLLVIQRHPVKTTHVYTYHVDGFIPGGGLYVYTPESGQLRELVNAGEGEIIDCDLSFDAKEVLFSWKRKGAAVQDVAQSGQELCLADPEQNYQIFRINSDGTGLRQLTDGPCNNLSPRWLPDGGIVFTSDRRAAFAYCWVSSSPVLHRMDRDGGGVTRISHSYLMDFTPCVLDDGRILYTRWEYVDRPAIPIQGLWTIRPDGTGLAGFYGNRVLSPATFMQAQPVPGSAKVLCLLTTHNGDPRGAIGLVDPSHGGNAQAGIRNLTPEVNIGRVDAGDGNHFANAGAYETPFPVDASLYLVSRAGSIELRDDAGTPPAVLLSRPAGGMGYYSPVPVRPRVRPPVLPPFQPAGHTDSWATVFMSDVYNGLEPTVRRGEVTQVAVVEEIAKTQFAPVQSRAFGFQFPVVSCGATYAPKKIWGYADVAADGSAHFQVPAGLPIYFLALDAEGRAVQRMRTFTHFQPGEVQSCVGCHADRNYATHTRPQTARAAAGPPQELRPPDWGARPFSYREVVQPVLDRHCVECHHARDPQGGLDLAGDATDFFNVSYEHLARQGTWGARNFMAGGTPASRAGRNPWTSWIPTVNGTEASILQVEPKTWGSPASKLADLVLDGHPDRSGKKRVQVPEADRRRVMAWIDLNVPYYPTSSSKDLRAAGCRRIYPPELDATLNKVAAARCAGCHEKGVPRDFYTRIEQPELNRFLLAPLAKSAGGTARCGAAVFADRNDPDYQAILKTFAPVAAQLAESPRDDLVAATRGGSP